MVSPATRRTNKCIVCRKPFRQLEVHLLLHSIEDVLVALATLITKGVVEPEEALASCFRGDSLGLAMSFAVPARYCDALPPSHPIMEEHVQLLVERIAARVSCWAESRFINDEIGYGLFTTKDLLPGKYLVGCAVASEADWPQVAWHALDYSLCSMQVGERCVPGYLWGPARLVNHRAGERSAELQFPYTRTATGAAGRRLCPVQLRVRHRIRKGAEIRLDYTLSRTKHFSFQDIKVRSCCDIREVTLWGNEEEVQVLCASCQQEPVGIQSTVSILRGPGLFLMDILRNDNAKMRALDDLIEEVQKDCHGSFQACRLCKGCWMEHAAHILKVKI